MSYRDLVSRQIPEEIRRATLENEERVYTTRIGDSWFLYRPLLYGEWKKAQRVLLAFGDAFYEDYLIETCLILPKETDKILAFYIKSIANHIADISGFDNPIAFEQSLKMARANMGALEPGVDVFLKTSLLLKDEDLDKMSFMERMKLLSYSEVITQRQIPLSGDKKKRRRPPKGMPIDMAGIEDAFDSGFDSQVLQTDPHGRPSLQRDTESFSVTNTKLRDR